eukprot:jgi/Bigna1/127205/aug1.4_g1913
MSQTLGLQMSQDAKPRNVKGLKLQSRFPAFYMPSAWGSFRAKPSVLVPRENMLLERMEGHFDFHGPSMDFTDFLLLSHGLNVIQSSPILPAAVAGASRLTDSNPPTPRTSVLDLRLSGALYFERLFLASMISLGKGDNEDIDVVLPSAPLEISSPFVSHTFKNRIPQILQRTLDYSKDKLKPQHVEGVEALIQEIKGDKPLQPITDAKHDADEWNTALKGYVDRKATWSQAPWFLWETYMYRRLASITHFWETGVDYFAAEKRKGYIKFITKKRRRFSFLFPNSILTQSLAVILNGPFFVQRVR